MATSRRPRALADRLASLVPAEDRESASALLARASCRARCPALEEHPRPRRLAELDLRGSRGAAWRAPRPRIAFRGRGRGRRVGDPIPRGTRAVARRRALPQRRPERGRPRRRVPRPRRRGVADAGATRSRGGGARRWTPSRRGRSGCATSARTCSRPAARTTCTHSWRSVQRGPGRSAPLLGRSTTSCSGRHGARPARHPLAPFTPFERCDEQIARSGRTFVHSNPKPR